MPDEPTPAPSAPSTPEVRPLDLGLSEGKSMAFAPTAVEQPAGPPIGGLAPAGPNGASAEQAAPVAAAANASAQTSDSEG